MLRQHRESQDSTSPAGKFRSQIAAIPRPTAVPSGFGNAVAGPCGRFSTREDRVSALLLRFSAQRSGSSTGAGSCGQAGSVQSRPNQSVYGQDHQPSRPPEDPLPRSGTLNTTRHIRAQRIFPLNPIRLRSFPLQ